MQEIASEDTTSASSLRVAMRVLLCRDGAVVLSPHLLAFLSQAADRRSSSLAPWTIRSTSAGGCPSVADSSLDKPHVRARAGHGPAAIARSRARAHC